MPETELYKYPTWKWIVGIVIMLVAFLAIRNIDAFTQRIINQEAISKEILLSNQTIRERLVLLEANYNHIISGISELKQSQEKVLNSIAEHMRRDRKVTE